MTINDWRQEMSKLLGSDFIGIQAEDLETAKAFYGDKMGLPVMQERPDAVVLTANPFPLLCANRL